MILIYKVIISLPLSFQSLIFKNWHNVMTILRVNLTETIIIIVVLHIHINVSLMLMYSKK